ncbi:hypothetical protein J6590_092789 [Homalodisca vitripennis]|nr:hypothetical protein J6590_092789 [Homalodisca vitripennis]
MTSEERDNRIPDSEYRKCICRRCKNVQPINGNLHILISKQYSTVPQRQSSSWLVSRQQEDYGLSPRRSAIIAI